MKKFSVKARYRIGTAVIVLLFCSVVSVLIYYYLKESATRTIYKETEIFIQAADATRTYVKDVLRPEITRRLPPGTFIPQAMSTSFVGREIMARLRQRFPDFQYRRAARNPMNPINQADAFEISMLDWFREHPSAGEWHGLIHKQGASYYSRLRAIYAESECLVCHGDPRDAPADMKKLYGTRGGYGYRVGDVVAADTIYIPVDVSFVRIKETALGAFLVTAIFLFTLIAMLYLLFNRTVVLELKGILSTFRSLSGKPADENLMEIEASQDEFAQLKNAFETVAADLTQAHGELTASESKYRHLFENSRDAIFIFDRQGRVSDINAAGIRMFGFTDRQEALSIETLLQLFWDTRDGEAFVEKLTSQGFVQGLEVSMVNREGRRIEAMISAAARRDETGAVIGIEGIFRDITEKQKLEKYLAQAEKLAAIGQLAAGVAHEINNPLGVIACYSNLIGKDLDENSPAAKDLQIIKKHTEQCKSVVQALLSFARISDPKKAPVNIHGCIETVLSILNLQFERHKISIHKQFGSDIPRITADASQMEQVFMNLLINGVQCQPNGGEIKIKTTLDKTARWLVIQISDSGPGIAEKYIDRIFDPFFTTKSEGQGTGLGLSVSFGIVQRHGGDITVKSAPGRGSTFTIRLPLDEGPQRAEKTT